MAPGHGSRARDPRSGVPGPILGPQNDPFLDPQNGQIYAPAAYKWLRNGSKMGHFRGLGTPKWVIFDPFLTGPEPVLTGPGQTSPKTLQNHV